MADNPVIALIVAAGSGSRMGGDVPKQFRDLGGQSVLAHAIDAMTSHPAIDEVRVVIGPGQKEAALIAIGDHRVGEWIEGGAERADSVRKGLETLPEDAIVLVHDAARPFCPPQVVDRLLAALETADGAVPVLPVADTLASGSFGTLEASVERKNLVRVQTPQAFHVGDLRYAIDEAGTSRATDESSIMLAAGLKMATIEGDRSLEKLTTQADFDDAAARLASAMISRTGLGFDVHAFTGDGPIMMGGIEIPHDRGLAGHSDADVVLHALTDALLGAAGLGDIGQHFPPSDPQWKGAPSDRFLAFACEQVRKRGGAIDFLDCTVICEAPKVGPHREAMRERVAQIADLPQSSVSIKATTSERLGFTGRGEGIAAQAAATVRLPR